MAVRVVIIIGVVLVVLFVASVVLGARSNSSTGSADLTTSTDAVRSRFDGLMAKPLANHTDNNGEIVWPEVRETTRCLVVSTGCAIGPNQARTLIVVKSDDNVRRLRRATFAQLRPGSTAGSAVDVVFTPVNDDPSAGEVRSKAEAAPTAGTASPPELGRVRVNISQSGGQLTVTCRPATATCMVKLVAE